METEETKNDFRTLFNAGLSLKIFFSAVEILGGVIVALVPRALVEHLAVLATAGELAQDPDDFVATTLREAAHSFAIHTHYLLAGYMILYGAVKVVLCILLLNGVKSAYPLFIVALGVFGSYGAYRAVATSNIGLGLLVGLDIVLMFLAAYEYRRFETYSS